ncbi:ATP-binding protein [Caenimonas koreensis]|uniref:PAS domain-containing sensor histidine kinase n=1 Tax=Caenimonas koreensis TaxID=367474 RepID=UPI00378480C8
MGSRAGMVHGGGPFPDSQSAIEHAPCGLLQTDADGAIVWSNRTFCQWVGYGAQELVGQRRLQDLFTVGGRIFHQTHWAPLLQIQGSIAEVKLEIVTRSGERLPMIMNAILRERDGHVQQEIAMYVARDRDKYERELIQSRTKLEDAVAQANRLQAEAKDRALFAEQMMGIVSHDLRNPLSAIHMGAALLTRTGATQEQQTVLARITRSTDRANRLISELLDFTQARMGKGLAVTRQPVQLHALVRESVEELKMAFANRVLQHEQGTGDAPCYADPDRLVQLVGNLVANAMAYGSRDAPVTVRTCVDGPTFSITVHNHGEPIRQDLLDTIFQPMVRGENGNASGRSVGLGLFIVSEIARMHGGAVTARSTLEGGTEFTARLQRE